MKTILKQTAFIACLALSASISSAKTEIWTNSEGKKAKMELLSVEEADGGKVAKFRTTSGRTITLPLEKFSDESKNRLNEWKAEESGDSEDKTSNVFHDFIDGNLVKLDGKRFKRLDETPSPKKYVVFYYTASWCGPCQKFTPSLVDWYNENKNDNFELVLVTSDSSEDSMKNYAAEKNMPWPQLKLTKAEKFKAKYEHGVTGIPSVIVCDLEGNNLGNYRSRLSELTKMIAE